MAKKTLQLNAIFYEGKNIKQPGEIVSVDDSLYLELEKLGMVDAFFKEDLRSKKTKNSPPPIKEINRDTNIENNDSYIFDDEHGEVNG